MTPSIDHAEHKRRVRVKAARAVMSAGARRSYTGASKSAPNIAMWRPPLRSADADILRDSGTIRARARDLRRNHPYAQQAVRASRLGVIGRKLRYSCRPDWRYLGIDEDEAVRWGQEWERIWESYAHGLGFQSDARRMLNFTQQMALVHDCDFTDGEALVSAEWDERRTWRTCFQIVDVDRLSNPHAMPDSDTLRAGIAIDELSAPVGYYIRNGHPRDIGDIGYGNADVWSFIRRETDWGRPVMLHTFEMERPAQTRGISSFASVITAMKMGAEYTETALQQAILQASYAAVIISQQNYEKALEVINGLDPTQARSIMDLAEENLAAAMEHHEEVQLRFNGSSIPVLWPGEDLKMVTPGTGAVAIGDFQAHATKSYAAGTGTDPIQVSQDYAQVNYSSAKMAAATSFRHYEMRRERLVSAVAMPKVACALEEAVFSGALALPKGLKPYDFYAARAALIAGTFLTQGAPMLDPVKERQAQQLSLQMGLATLQSIASEDGEDYRDIMAQQEREANERALRGLGPVMAGPMPNALPGNGAENGAEDEPADDAPTEEPA